MSRCEDLLVNLATLSLIQSLCPQSSDFLPVMMIDTNGAEFTLAAALCTMVPDSPLLPRTLQCLLLTSVLTGIPLQQT